MKAQPHELVVPVGKRQTFVSYLTAYEHAVKQLFDSVANGREPAELIAPPLLFLMRHSMELGYKFTLWELHQMNGDIYDFEKFKDHRLVELHAALRNAHRVAVAKYDLPENHVESFEGYCAKTEAGMKEFSRLDFRSMSFRYPVDNKGSPSLPKNETVDLIALKQLYDEAMVLLRHTSDVLSEYVDIRKWMEAEAMANCY